MSEIQTISIEGDATFKLYPMITWRVKVMNEEEDFYERKEIEKIDCKDKVGRFWVEYQRKTNGYFGMDGYGKGDDSKCIATFYEKGEPLMTKEVSGNMLILFGDGKNKDKTYYTLYNYDDGNIHIYDLNDKFIRKTVLGWGAHLGLRKVGKKNAIAAYMTPCNHWYGLAFVDLKVLFDPTQSEPEKGHYDMSRNGICSSVDFKFEHKYVPVQAGPDGLFVQDTAQWDGRGFYLACEPCNEVKGFNFEWLAQATD